MRDTNRNATHRPSCDDKSVGVLRISDSQVSARGFGRRLWPVELALRFDKEEAEALWQLFEPIDAKCVTT